MAKRFKAPVFYPSIGDFYHCEIVDADPNVTIKTEEGKTVTTNLIGRYNFVKISQPRCV